MPSSSSDSTLHYGWSDLALLKRFFNLNTLLQIRYVFRNSILKFGCKRPLRTCAAKFKFSKNEFYFFKFANKPSFKFKEQSAKRKAGILFFLYLFRAQNRAKLNLSFLKFLLSINQRFVLFNFKPLQILPYPTTG